MKGKQLIESSLRGIIVYGFVNLVLYLVYPFIGILTGVYGLCAFVSKWWIGLYEKPLILIPLLAAISCAIIGLTRHFAAKKNISLYKLP